MSPHSVPAGVVVVRPSSATKATGTKGIPVLTLTRSTQSLTCQATPQSLGVALDALVDPTTEAIWMLRYAALSHHLGHEPVLLDQRIDEFAATNCLEVRRWE